MLVEVNDCYAVYEGLIDGDEIKGQFSNEVGMRDTSRVDRIDRPHSPESHAKNGGGQHQHHPLV